MNFSALYNGFPAQAVPLSNRALAYGDGLFETLRVDDRRARFLERHLQRLQRDSARLGLAVDVPALRADIAALLEQHGDGVLKIIVARESAARGYFADDKAPVARLLQFFPQRNDSDTRARDGVAIRLCRQTLAEQPSLAGMKHLNRLEQVRARSEWSGTAIAEGLMLDTGGRVIEGTMSNVFLQRDGVLMTPSLRRCGVAGILRDIVLQRLAPGITDAIETELLPADLAAADEVFVCNSVIGIWPVRKIECMHKAIGETTLALQHKLSALLADEAADCR